MRQSLFRLFSHPRPKPTPKTITGVDKVIAISSNKGGVGKSTSAVNLGLGLSRKGLSVGLLDIDVYGPSFPLLLNLQGHKPSINENKKIIPLENFGVKAMSMGFLTPQGVAASWRGPMLISAINQLLFGIDWGGIDILVIDLPPGTGDTHISLVQTVQLTGAVLISTPQQLAIEDLKRGLDLFNKCKVPVVGLIENMSYWTCGNCQHKEYIFGENGGKNAAKDLNIPFLGEVPVHKNIAKYSDEGNPIVISEPKSHQAEVYLSLSDKIIEFLEKEKETKKEPTIEFE